jgi:hypothetical protein
MKAQQTQQPKLYKLSKVAVPYPMAPALDEAQRERHMSWAVSQGFPRIKQRPMTRYTMQIAAYGPSLADTWQDINPLRPLITMSGSLQFLLEKGLKPRWGRWFHVECDPRPHKIRTLPRHKDVVYVIASCAHPKLFKHVEGMHVVLFHAISGPHTKQWVAENDPGQILVGAGSTVGLTSIHIGGVFGFRHFEIHGMDGSWRGEARHAGPHYGFVHGQRPSQINPAYTTSRMMDNANFEIRAMLKHFPLFCVFHGEGVVQDWVGKAGLHNAARAGTPQAHVVRDLDYEEVSPEQARELLEAGMPLLEEAA